MISLFVILKLIKFSSNSGTELHQTLKRMCLCHECTQSHKKRHVFRVKYELRPTDARLRHPSPSFSTRFHDRACKAGRVKKEEREVSVEKKQLTVGCLKIN